MDLVELHLVAGWAGVLLAFLSGALIGRRFHHSDWLGGYASFPRRMVRLGHISFVGLGFVNMAFAFSLTVLTVNQPFSLVASVGFLVGAVSMPASCFATAYRERFRTLFAVPVSSLVIGVVALLVGWVFP